MSLTNCHYCSPRPAYSANLSDSGAEGRALRRSSDSGRSHHSSTSPSSSFAHRLERSAVRPQFGWLPHVAPRSSPAGLTWLDVGRGACFYSILRSHSRQSTPLQACSRWSLTWNSRGLTVGRWPLTSVGFGSCYCTSDCLD